MAVRYQGPIRSHQTSTALKAALIYPHFFLLKTLALSEGGIHGGC